MLNLPLTTRYMNISEMEINYFFVYYLFIIQTIYLGKISIYTAS